MILLNLSKIRYYICIHTGFSPCFLHIEGRRLLSFEAVHGRVYFYSLLIERAFCEYRITNGSDNVELILTRQGGGYIRSIL